MAHMKKAENLSGVLSRGFGILVSSDSMRQTGTPASSETKDLGHMKSRSFWA